MKSRKWLLLLALLPSLAMADGISYRYVQIDYSHGEDGPVENGVSFRGSTQSSEHTYLFADYTRLNTIGRLDIDLASLGAGYFGELTDKVDYLFEAAIENIDPGDTGFSLSTGLRAELGSHFELGAKVGYADFGDLGTGYLASLYGLIKINETWGINLTAESYDDDLIYSVGIRLSF